MHYLWWISIVAILLLTLGLAAIFRRKSWRKPLSEGGLRREKRSFHIEREHLEAKFLKLASLHVNADLPRWVDCDFEDDVAYVRSRSTGELSALVAVTLTAEDGEDDRDCQTGTAVFRLDRDHWETDGRAILNLSPAEAVQFYRDDLEIVEEECSHQA